MTFSSSFLESEESLHAEAVERTGYEEFGGPEYLAVLRRLLKAYDEEAQFTDIGRERTRDLIIQTLVSRLYSERGWRDHPDALQMPVTCPLIVTGIPRSGTTALHKLLSLDPQFQGLEHWLSRTPIVRPPRDQWAKHPLYRRAAAILDDLQRDQPVIKTAHGQSVEEVDECYNLLLQSFIVQTFPNMAHVPSFDAWYLEQDETPSYRRFADNLRLIGFLEADKRWLLKNPNHIFAIEAVLNVFPDALIVQTHRTPVEAIPSLCSVSFAGRKYYEGDRADPNIVGARHARHWRIALERTMRAREKHPDKFFDVRFRDFENTPIKVLNEVYERFALELRPEVESEMHRWLQNNRRLAGGGHHYCAAQFGLSEASLRRDYSDYIEQFAL